MKKIIILRASENELANQLWNYASIYAYSLECNHTIENPSFFEYGKYFSMPTPNWLITLIFFLPFKNYTKRRSSFRRRVWRKFYIWYTNILIQIHRDCIISNKGAKNEPYYLPPTKVSDEKLRRLENSECFKKNGKIYFDGWLFRNPLGLEKYRDAIREYFQPRKDIKIRVKKQIENLRKKYTNIIGVHLRQGDYKTWRDGAYFIEHKRVREIIEEYLKTSQKNRDQTCFLITSDGPVKETYFSGLNIFISKDNAIADLFLLTSTDTIIGSNSTFGAFASYYGNIPFIVMQKNPIDWDYYRDKTKFFQNKYSTMVHY